MSRQTLYVSTAAPQLGNKDLMAAMATQELGTVCLRVPLGSPKVLFGSGVDR